MLLDEVCGLEGSDGDVAFELPDVRADPRFASRAAAARSSFRFYAGNPFRFEGVALGAVCVLDHRPGDLTAWQRQVLSDLATLVELALTRREQRLRLEEQQERLSESESSYGQLWETTRDALVFVGPDNVVLRVNPAVKSVFGWEPASLQGQDVAVLIPQERRTDYLHALHLYFKQGRRRRKWRGLRTTALHAGGSEFPVEVSVTEGRMVSQKGLIALVRAASHDQEEVMTQQLRQSQRLEAIGMLAGGVAHDCNNVLAGILGNAALAEYALESGNHSGALSSIKLISRSAARARDLVHKILAFARNRERPLQPWRLSPLITDTLDLLKISLPPNVELRWEARDEAAAIVDATQVQQVVMNLCTNAWHAMIEHGGKLTVLLDLVQLPRMEAAAMELVPGPYARITVQDTGTGMDAATRARLFDPFFTTKPAGMGTGLGLPAAHATVTSHKGAITVESELGRGTVFCVYLPATDETPSSAEAPSLLQHGIVGKGERVLYVDDNEAMRSW